MSKILHKLKTNQVEWPSHWTTKQCSIKNAKCCDHENMNYVKDHTQSKFPSQFEWKIIKRKLIKFWIF